MAEFKNTEQIIQDLERINPLALPQYIAQCEFYDSTSSRKILDEAIQAFEKDGGRVNSILKPIMFSIVDGLIFSVPSLRRKGFTAQRVYEECESFSYEGGAKPSSTGSTAYMDYKNAQDYNQKYANDVRGDYDRVRYGNPNAMEKYKDRKIRENGPGKNLEDEYTGRKDITPFKNDPDLRRNDPTGRQNAQTDHIVPLKAIHNQLAGNYALSDNDIRMIANRDYNYALTSARINQAKGDSTNAEFVKEHPELDGQTKETMLRKGKEAQSAVDGATNDVVGKNLTFQGTVYGKDMTDACIDFAKRNGRQPTELEKAEIKRNLQNQKTLDVYDKLGKNAADQAKNHAVGNIILFLIKPLYYELKDTMVNGFKDGVGASSGLEAIKIRFSRVKDYVIKNAAAFIGDNLWEFVKGLVSSLIEGIISLFVGIFKQILKLLKEGFRVFVQSVKILWGKNSASMSPAEKGDAIIKLIGGSVMAIAGIGIEILLNRIGIGGTLATFLATMFSGMAAALFMYLLDKVDLFSVKAERREKRIREIFELRKQELLENTRKFDAAVRNKMRQQWIEYERLKLSMDSALEVRDYKKVNQSLDGFARFFQVSLPYSNTEGFIEYVKSHKTIVIE